jgi:hypothetical protein
LRRVRSIPIANAIGPDSFGINSTRIPMRYVVPSLRRAFVSKSTVRRSSSASKKASVPIEDCKSGRITSSGRRCSSATVYPKFAVAARLAKTMRLATTST